MLSSRYLWHLCIVNVANIEHYQLMYRVLNKCKLLLISISHNSRHIKYLQYIIDEQHTKIMLTGPCFCVLVWFSCQVFWFSTSFPRQQQLRLCCSLHINLHKARVSLHLFQCCCTSWSGSLQVFTPAGHLDLVPSPSGNLSSTSFFNGLVRYSVFLLIITPFPTAYFYHASCITSLHNTYLQDTSHNGD